MKPLVFFLIAAAVVAILAVVALREEPVAPAAPVVEVDETQPAVAVAPPRAEVSKEEDPQPPPEAAGPEQLDNMDLMMLLREYGFGRLEGRWREWAMSRGYPAFDGSGSHYYEQPYEQYDDETLRGLADNGDMWAQQILAKRIARSNPAEAIELYREAAIRGSIYAMTEISNLYGRIADKRREVEFKSDDLALEQVYAMRDAPVSPEVAGYAWTAVAEMAGTEPMFGNIAASQFARKLSDEQKEEACNLARGMYDDVMEQRASLGLGDFERSPPPLVYWDPATSASCDDDTAPRLDLSGCRELEMTENGQANTVWLCADESS